MNKYMYGLLLMMCSILPAQANTLLSSAAKGDVAKVQQQLAQGAAVDMRDSRGRTPLLLATWGNHPQVAKLLIDAGADVNAKDNKQDSPYLVAGAEGRNEILLMTLQRGADLRSLNRYGGTALIPACEHGHVETVRILIRAGVDINHVNNLGWTCLMEAVILGSDSDDHLQVVQQLIAAKANLNLKDKDGMTALQHAKKRKLTRITTALVQAGAK